MLLWTLNTFMCNVCVLSSFSVMIFELTLKNWLRFKYVCMVERMQSAIAVLDTIQLNLLRLTYKNCQTISCVFCFRTKSSLFSWKRKQNGNIKKEYSDMLTLKGYRVDIDIVTITRRISKNVHNNCFLAKM